MSKNLYITEKPSVAKEFGKVLKENFRSRDGYLESDNSYITWCVGHLVTMSYPDVYDIALKRWTLATLPFIPDNNNFKYEVIPSVKKQYSIVENLLKKDDVSCIYVCTDSGREGEYIYRLVEQNIGGVQKTRRRVWIDSQTEEEITRGIREAKLLEEYDNLSASAYLRAKEDYLMGINFSRVLTLKYGDYIKSALSLQKNAVISVGRVMTCVLGMVVNREREVRDFVKTPFFKIVATLSNDEKEFTAEWKAVEGSKYYNSPLIYKDNGFLKKEDADNFINSFTNTNSALVEKVETKKEKKNPPLLYNLAELQNDCSKMFKISPDETLKVVQELYEKKLTTYPRTDARVLSTAVAKEINKNIKGICQYPRYQVFASKILEDKSYQNIAKSKYVNDKQITDHYAIIPTGQGYQSYNSLSPLCKKVYEVICGRFLSVFYPAAVYEKRQIQIKIQDERFFISSKNLLTAGYLPLIDYSFLKSKSEEANEKETEEPLIDLSNIKKGMTLPLVSMNTKEGETSPPKRFSSGSLILAMENAGQLIEEEELREQIKGAGIGTSATRAEILKKLVANEYLKLNKKTQIITPTCFGEVIFEVVNGSIRSMLNPKLTASWEKGLSQVAAGSITEEEYMDKLVDFITKLTNFVKTNDMRRYLNPYITKVLAIYK